MLDYTRALAHYLIGQLVATVQAIFYNPLLVHMVPWIDSSSQQLQCHMDQWLDGKIPAKTRTVALCKKPSQRTAEKGPRMGTLHASALQEMPREFSSLTGYGDLFTQSSPRARLRRPSGVTVS